MSLDLLQPRISIQNTPETRPPLSLTSPTLPEKSFLFAKTIPPNKKPLKKQIFTCLVYYETLTDTFKGDQNELSIRSSKA